jgi:hypothetical protein
MILYVVADMNQAAAPTLLVVLLKTECMVMHNSWQFSKYFADCFIMGSRLVLILDDLLWVLTDSQLKAALHFLDSLTGLVQKATELTRIKKAARKLEVVLVGFHFTDYLMRIVNYLLAILLCVFGLDVRLAY